MKAGKAIERVAGAYVASLYAHPAFQALKARESGCLLAWGRMMLDAGEAVLPLDELRSHAAYFAHFEESDFTRMLSELRAMRLVAVDGALLQLLPLASAMKAMGAESERRKDGWQKRRQQAPRTPVAAPAARVAPVIVAPAKPHAAPASTAPGQASLLGIEPAVARAAPAKKIAKCSSHDFVRIGATNDDDSPVIMRLGCKGDRTAEFTEAFAASMSPLYPGVDVHTEMLKSAEWCRSKPECKKTLTGARRFVTGWLSRAAQSHHVTMAVVAAKNQGNGFGQGGRYEEPSSSSSGAASDGFDDLLDMADMAASSKPVVMGSAVPPRRPFVAAPPARNVQQPTSLR